MKGSNSGGTATLDPVASLEAKIAQHRNAGQQHLDAANQLEQLLADARNTQGRIRAVVTAKTHADEMKALQTATQPISGKTTAKPGPKKGTGGGRKGKGGGKSMRQFFVDAIQKAERPLSVSEIMDWAMKHGLETSSKTPNNVCNNILRSLPNVFQAHKDDGGNVTWSVKPQPQAVQFQEDPQRSGTTQE